MRRTLSSLALIGCVSCGGGETTPDAPAADAPAPDAVPAVSCADQDLPALPADPSLRGPWAVGARTVQIGRLTVEVWYPAEAGSERGEPAVRYDIREALNPSSRDLVPDADNPWQDCDCYRDLPIDATHGPYPVLVFVHGTAAFRHQSLHLTTHWASRGFVVLAADHPGLMLGDLLATFCPDDPSGDQDVSGDVDAMLEAAAAPTGPLAFLDGRVDATRAGVVGHSAGGGAAADSTTTRFVRAVASLAGNVEADASPTLVRSVFMGGSSDAVVAFSAVRSAYEASAPPAHLVGLAGAGHLVFSDLCDTENTDGQNLLEVAEEYGVCGADLAGFLFDCDPTYLAGPIGWDITNYATGALFEAVLQCSATSPALDTVDDRFADVDTYEERL